MPYNFAAFLLLLTLAIVLFVLHECRTRETPKAAWDRTAVPLRSILIAQRSEHAPAKRVTFLNP